MREERVDVSAERSFFEVYPPLHSLSAFHCLSAVLVPCYPIRRPKAGSNVSPQRSQRGLHLGVDLIKFGRRRRASRWLCYRPTDHTSSCRLTIPPVDLFPCRSFFLCLYFVTVKIPFLPLAFVRHRLCPTVACLYTIHPFIHLF